jgi:hypothetical protein
MNTVLTELSGGVVARASRAPTLSRVFRQQMKLMQQAGVSSMGLMVLGGSTLLFLGMDPRVARLPFPADYLPLTGLLLGTVAWPPLVWRGQGPLRRSYHRVLPVDQLTHDLLKVTAGAISLMVGVAVVLLPLLVAAGMSPVLSGLLTRPSWLVWLNFFTGPLIIYLLVSCVPMLTDHPLEWLLGLTAGFVGLTFLADSYGLSPIADLINVLMREPIGLVYALNGAYAEQPWLYYANLGLFGEAPRYGAWITATVLWIGVGVFAVGLASNYANSRKSA